ncbi:hypothetical protein H0H92_013036 [Tricholoma furcatifolium]|nr:hypothetical protein H0H92_013036 [Tricholoma furcatifolium]
MAIGPAEVHVRLPSELKALIASYCSSAALVSLALLQRQFQAEAERALYATVVVTSYSLKSPRHLSVFETLAASREKATYVRFLQVAFRRPSPEHDMAAKALMPVLPTLVSLKDLRLRFEEKEPPFGKELTEILRSGHFQLRTLFCNEWLGISEIVKSQSSLQCLVVYALWVTALRALDQLQAESIPLPITCGLGAGEGIVLDTHISLFPVYLRPETRSTYFQTLESVISRDRARALGLDCNKISEVSLYFESISDTNYVSNFVLDMSAIFPNFWQLGFRQRRPEKLDLAEVKKIIKPARMLEYLDYYQWNKDGMMKLDKSYAIDDDLKRRYALEWEGVCPKLSSVEFIDGSYIQKLEELGWVLNRSY